jgi:hypothetical protein
LPCVRNTSATPHAAIERPKCGHTRSDGLPTCLELRALLLVLTCFFFSICAIENYSSTNNSAARDPRSSGCFTLQSGFTAELRNCYRISPDCLEAYHKRERHEAAWPDYDAGLIMAGPNFITQLLSPLQPGARTLSMSTQPTATIYHHNIPMDPPADFSLDVEDPRSEELLRIRDGYLATDVGFAGGWFSESWDSSSECTRVSVYLHELQCGCRNRQPRGIPFHT